MPRHSAEAALEILDLRKKNIPIIQIMELTGRTRSSIGQILRTRDPETGLPKTPKRQGRPCHEITPAQDQMILDYFAANEKASLKKAASALGMSWGVIFRRLRAYGLKSGGTLEKNPLCQAHRNDRISWCLYKRELMRENPGLFERTIFSDETQFNLYNGQVVHWSLSKERKANYLPELDQGGVMVWGAISHLGPVALVSLHAGLTGDTYSKILTETLLPYLDVHGRDMELQQKSRTAFTSGLMKRYFYDEGVKLLHWPRSSADLNPIHDVWLLMEKCLREKGPRDLDELREMISEVWREVCTREQCDILYGSIGDKLEKVINHRGAMRFNEVKPPGPRSRRSKKSTEDAEDAPKKKKAPKKSTPTIPRVLKKKIKKAKRPIGRPRKHPLSIPVNHHEPTSERSLLEHQNAVPVADFQDAKMAPEEPTEYGKDTVLVEENPKRSRGRPKKYPLPARVEPFDHHEPLSEDIIFQNLGLLPIASLPNNEPISEEPMESGHEAVNRKEKPKRPRGRPRKYWPIPTQNLQTSPIGEESVESGDGAVVSGRKFKRPRGRPRKYPKASEVQSVEPVVAVPTVEPNWEEPAEAGYETVILNLDEAWDMTIQQGRELSELDQLDVLKQIGVMLYNARMKALGQSPASPDREF